ncbi:LytTR family transcriptional regulator DNA-binding domain-containing protein [Chryseobacterium terrae]|uniref:LytTR family transcriptional regulator DNA-binding domain-containing protein n=1 Tax=Chryseobacterium terrae TaxID=3163299 RepID=A0ABW8Y8J8_9FLAO
MFRKNCFIKTPKFLLLFGVLLFQTFLFSQHKSIIFSAETDSISLYKNAEIAYTNQENFSAKFINQLDFKNFNPSTLKQHPIPDTLQYAVLKFSITNNQEKNAHLYLSAKEDIAYMQAYELKSTHYQFVAKTGYANRISDFSIKSNDKQLILTSEKNKTTEYIVYLKKYKYILPIPEIQLQSETKYLKEVEKKQSKPLSLYFLFTIFIAGFQFALLIFGIFKIYVLGFKKIYFFFALQCLLFILFYLNEIHILVFETRFLPFIYNKMVYEALGDLFIVVFNFLIISFFDLDKKSFLYRFLVWITIFWVVLFFVEAIPFINNPVIISVFRFILNTAAIVDFITLSCVFYFAYFHRNGYRKYLFIGIFIAMVSSFEVALPRFLNLINLDPNWIKISDSSYLLLQICDNLNFCFFFISFIIREKELSVEKDSLEKEHTQTVDELKNLKKIIEKENIILKDKTKINLDQLIYIKADDHYLNVHTIEKKNHFVRGKLGDIAVELPSNFVRCHRSYIINKNYIKQAQSKFIIMNDNSEIPISRGFKI